MSSRLTKMIMAAALVASSVTGAAFAQPSAGPGPNAAMSEPNPANSLPRGATTGQTNPMPNDGRIVLQPQQSAETMPTASQQRRMTRHHMRRNRAARRAAMRSSTTTTAPMTAAPMTGAPMTGTGTTAPR